MSLDDTLYTQALFPERCGYPIYTPCPTSGKVCEVGQIGVFDRGEWSEKSDSQTMEKYGVYKDRNFSLLLSDARVHIRSMDQGQESAPHDDGDIVLLLEAQHNLCRAHVHVSDNDLLELAQEAVAFNTTNLKNETDPDDDELEDFCFVTGVIQGDHCLKYMTKVRNRTLEGGSVESGNKCHFFFHCVKVKRQRALSDCTGDAAYDSWEVDSDDEQEQWDSPADKRKYEPVGDLLDYILAYPMSNEEDIRPLVAVASDTHLYAILQKPEDFADVRAALDKIRPRVVWLDEASKIARVECNDWCQCREVKKCTCDLNGECCYREL